MDLSLLLSVRVLRSRPIRGIDAGFWEHEDHSQDASISLDAILCPL